MIRKQVTGFINGKMGGLIKEISTTIIEADTDSYTMAIRLYTEDVGRMDSKAQESLIFNKKINNAQEWQSQEIIKGIINNRALVIETTWMKKIHDSKLIGIIDTVQEITRDSLWMQKVLEQWMFRVLGLEKMRRE